MITAQEFAKRRTAVLSQMRPNSVCIVPAAKLMTRSNDTEYGFRQNSDFHYLCGFPEADAVLVMSNQAHFEGGLSVLFCLAKDPLAEIWHGRRFGPDAAVKQFGLDQAFTLDQTQDALTELMDGHQHVYFLQGQDIEIDELIFACIKTLREAPKQSRIAPLNIADLREILHEMRLFKSANEAEIMRQAGKISSQAHCRAMQFCAPGKYEYQLEAELHHEFAMQGARYPAYGTIVGSGDNGCILHYTENQSQLVDGDLVLIDAGGELHGYAADITRTFPVSGRFSEPQSQLYNLVLAAQLKAFTLLKPGNTLKQATDLAIEVITEGLIELGLLSGSLEANIEALSYREFFMHGLSHWLGLDVHDVGHYKVDGTDRPLKAGMVITVEPGIYVSPTAQVDKKWCGIGIRIEDNLLITEQGHEVLTSAVPKTIADIELLMAS
jgi:Xaa-Pro aminopeptidase